MTVKTRARTASDSQASSSQPSSSPVLSAATTPVRRTVRAAVEKTKKQPNCAPSFRALLARTPILMALLAVFLVLGVITAVRMPPAALKVTAFAPPSALRHIAEDDKYMWLSVGLALAGSLTFMSAVAKLSSTDVYLVPGAYFVADAATACAIYAAKDYPEYSTVLLVLAAVANSVRYMLMYVCGLLVVTGAWITLAQGGGTSDIEALRMAASRGVRRAKDVAGALEREVSEVFEKSSEGGELGEEEHSGEHSEEEEELEKEAAAQE